MVEDRQAGLEGDVTAGGKHQHAADEHPEFPGPEGAFLVRPGKVREVTAQHSDDHQCQHAEGAHGRLACDAPMDSALADR